MGVSRDFKRKPNLNWPKILRCSGFRASFVNPELIGDTAVLQGVFFLTGAFLTFLQTLALREIPLRLTWDVVLRKFREAPVKKKHPVEGTTEGFGL